jgi:hypothetical protein
MIITFDLNIWLALINSIRKTNTQLSTSLEILQSLQGNLKIHFEDVYLDSFMIQSINPFQDPYLFQVPNFIYVSWRCYRIVVLFLILS